MNNKNISKSLFNGAAVSGLYLGLYFAFKYLLYSFMIPYTWVSLVLIIVYTIALICTPVVVYFLIKNFRTKVLSETNVFPLNLSWLYGMLLYVFASIISMPVHYFFYKERLPIVISYLDNVVNNLPSNLVKTSPELPNIIHQSIDTIGATPIYQLVLNDFSNNMIYGAVVSLVIGLILRRK